MDSQEYQQRRQALEEQLQADLNLIRAGYEAKLRALEMIWLTSAGQSSPPVETVPVETVARETVPAEVAPEPAAAEEPAVASTYDRRDALGDLLDVLPTLPEEFDKSDICRALGYTPPRATLYRVLAKLEREEAIAVVQSSQGRRKTLYRAV